ncbi:ImmA/IrrE family metallo-endopeptidase [Candidatus Poriferisocius sp.]|uniref:ImmA/IrrE family metallo-endopeptidase n=1 Tax=Candidatus Poriferisocius sp. TaxID=3101276 RepID=UPI003B5ADC98
MASYTVPITADVLTWAREEAGLTQAELAERVKTDVERLQAWEKAECSPTRGQFSKLVKALKRPSALFFLPQPPRDAGMPTALRKAPGLGDRRLSPNEIDQIRWARRLQGLMGWVLRDAGTPKVELANYRTVDDPLQVARAERSASGVNAAEQIKWATPAVAFRAWRSYLEDQGILVLQLSMGKDSIRGFSAWDDFAPMVAVNTAYHPTARIFTLFHEVAHLLTRTDAACQSFVIPGQQSASVERWCERFAAAFLLPADDLRQVAQAYGITAASPTDDPDTARRIAKKFSVSTRATAIRLQELDLAKPTLYPAVASQLAGHDWNAPGGGGGGRRASLKRIGQLGTRLPGTLMEAMGRGRLTTRDLADHLKLTTGQLEDLKGELVGS